jgi:7-carboxy-7-deazaguanine synthase (Cx14CxxC type)
MTYAVKEIFFTLQGEGANTGRAAVFVRFAGCNLWSGLERDRASAVCQFCDTEFVGTDGPGGGKFVSAEDLAGAALGAWPTDMAVQPKPLIVATGGEPLLQLDDALLDAFHAAGFEVAVETNGTRPAPAGLDWICVSPKANAELVQRQGDELKLVYPQEGVGPENFRNLDFTHFFLQPMDGPEQAANTEAAVRYIRAHPEWRLSIQTHKLIGIP